MEWKNFSENEAINCGVCTRILVYLKDFKDGVKFNQLEAHMRSNDVSTTTYHVNNHLKKAGMVIVDHRGAIKPDRFIKATEKGNGALSRTTP